MKTKKLLSKVLCFFIACSVCAGVGVMQVRHHADETVGTLDNLYDEEEKTIKYIGWGESYDYGSDTVYISKDVETGEIIPLSVGPFDGYCYAYLPQAREFVTEKINYQKSFNDLGERYRYDNYIEEMAAREVILGYEDGSFRPEKELTRAEMATVFTRLFGLPATRSLSCFEDVPQSHWASGYIMSLVDKGVFMKDTYFNPDKFVTREQLVAMTYRMLSDMGYVPADTQVDFSEYVDFDSVNEYAKIPYRALICGRYVMLDELIANDFMDTADDEILLHPQKPVTRIECADFLYQFIRMFFYNNAPAIRRADAPDVEIPILDGSTSTYEITKNIYNAFYQNYNKADGFPKAHSKTTNSYKRLIDGEVEMIFVPDAGEEVERYAKEKGVKLKFIPIANEALVFFTASDNPVGNITTEQLHDIYVNNGITNWKDIGGTDSVLAAYCRNADSGSHAQMENFILDGKEINESIVKERISVIMASILTDVDDYNKKNPNSYAMGYSLYYYFNNAQWILGNVDLKLMSINGVEPTDETISDGTYPYTTNYYAVIRDGENNPKVDEFVKLMQSEFGDEIVEMSGLGVM